MRGEVRKCPICGTPIRRGKLMCLAHWSMVPCDRQRAVNRTWKEFRRSDCGQPALMALREYRNAHDAAIKAVFDLIGARATTPVEEQVSP